MYKLRRLNVERMVAEENQKDKLISEGFELVEDEKVEDGENPPNGEEVPLNYSEMTIPDLQNICKDKGLSGYSNLSKDELVKFVEEKLAVEGR